MTRIRRAALTARGASLASHRDGRGAQLARRDEEEYREYLTEEQRSQLGCIARRMQRDWHHGLLRLVLAALMLTAASTSPSRPTTGALTEATPASRSSTLSIHP